MGEVRLQVGAVSLLMKIWPWRLWKLLASLNMDLHSQAPGWPGLVELTGKRAHGWVPTKVFSIRLQYDLSQLLTRFPLCYPWEWRSVLRGGSSAIFLRGGWKGAHLKRLVGPIRSRLPSENCGCLVACLPSEDCDTIGGRVVEHLVITSLSLLIDKTLVIRSTAKLLSAVNCTNANKMSIWASGALKSEVIKWSIVPQTGKGTQSWDWCWMIAIGSSAVLILLCNHLCRFLFQYGGTRAGITSGLW